MSAAPALRIVVGESLLDTRLSDAFATDPSTQIVARATDGFEAVRLTQDLQPDAVVMVCSLAGINGIEATRRIMTASPTPIVLAREAGAAELDQEAVRAGALATVAMPPPAGTSYFPARSAELVAAVRAMAGVKLVRRTNRTSARAAVVHGATPLKIVAIGASTGGPAVMHQIFSALGSDFPVPIVVTQHIAAGFVGEMVRWLDGSGGISVRVALAGETLRRGVAYLAPDNAHLEISEEHAIVLRRGAPVDGHCPSATPMFQSVARVYGKAALALILTGMGRDGVAGLADMNAAGGTVWAQDELSSAVFGMPGAAIDAGLPDLVLPLDAIAEQLLSAVTR